MGQRPARCECRPRHDADAGCRNPEGAARIQNVPAFARFAETFCQSLAHLPIDSAPDAPDKPGSSETGKDPTDKKTEAQKVAAVVDTLNAVRKDYGNNTPLTMDAEVCAMAEKMAKLQLDWLLGKYGTDPNGKRYTKDWNDISQLPVKGKKLVGVGGYAAYPTESVIRGWVKDTGPQNEG